jgi:hypothetical protein
MIQKKAQPEGWLFKNDDQDAGLTLAEDGIKLNRICRTFATQWHDNSGEVQLSNEKLR